MVRVRCEKNCEEGRGNYLPFCLAADARARSGGLARGLPPRELSVNVNLNNN